MLRSYEGLALRQLGTRRLRALLTCFGIVLGVGMMFGVLLLVSTVRSTFDDLIDSAWGTTDLLVTSSAGRLPERAVGEIHSDAGVYSVSPWVGAVFNRLDDDGNAIRGTAGKMMVAGFDPAGEDPFDFHFVAGRRARSGPELVVERGWARDRGVQLGERLAVTTPTGRARLRVVGIFEFAGGVGFGGQGMAGMPLDAARRVMGLPSGYLQASVKLRDRGDVDVVRDRLQRRLGAGVKVQTPGEAGDDLATQIEAFNIVLYFFSGIALFVGGFLILNSFNMTVLQRMKEIGTLRTLGATRAAVVRTVLVEALALGVAGAIAGLALGLGMAVGLVALMRGMGIPIAGLQVPASAAVLSVAVGLVVTILGSLRPALRAGSVPPIQAVLGGRGSAPKPRLRRAAIGLALFVPGLVFGGEFWFGGEAGDSFLVLAAGMTATMAMFAGIAVAAPFLIMPLVRALAAPLRRIAPTGGRLAADAASTNPARTAATAAALTIGLSVFVVNAGMSSSFMGSIHDQIDRSFARDFTVQPLGTGLDRAGEQIVPRSLRARIARMPEAEVVTPLRSTLLDLPGIESGVKQGLAVGIDPRVYGEVDGAPISGAGRAEALRGVARGDVIVGPLYARRAHLEVGDRIGLRGGAGSHRARVAGVLDTMTAYNGNLIQMSLATMRDVYGVSEDAQLAVKASSAEGRAALERGIAAAVNSDYPNIELLSAAEVKRSIDDQISQQFGLLNAIVAIAVIVSLLGVINTLAMSVIERTREIGVLRALGSSRWQVRLTMLHESLLITLSGSIAGLALGALIARVWVGGLEAMMPGIAFHFPVATAVGVALAAVALGVAAAIFPARRAARLKPIEAIGYE